MERLYTHVIRRHIQLYQQMIFLVGPRQVGKTTIAQFTKKFSDNFTYFNWDNQDHRSILISGPKSVANTIGLDRLLKGKSIVVFDEIHKYRKWKGFLKGFYDTYKDKVKIIVTGSTKLDIYKVGGDSLMGRYFLYRVHSLSVGEILRKLPGKREIGAPEKSTENAFKNLIRFGGFPEPFLKGTLRFYNRWTKLRSQQLFKEDIRDLTRIQEIGQLELLADLLQTQSGQLCNYSNLANKVNTSVDTIRRWIYALSAFYYCFIVRPWTRNVSRSLLKEPKLYLWDWSLVNDPGMRAENFIACHLLKAVHFWTDCGLGNYDLYFLRTKEKKEVDFLVTKNKDPWFLIEVKLSARAPLSPSLSYFHKMIQTKHAFQVVLNMDFVDSNCFKETKPIIVPAKTFLSQLV